MSTPTSLPPLLFVTTMLSGTQNKAPLFGATNTTAPAAGTAFGAFGTTTQQQGTQPAAGLFGGGTTGGNLFGQNQQQQQQQQQQQPQQGCCEYFHSIYVAAYFDAVGSVWRSHPATNRRRSLQWWGRQSLWRHQPAAATAAAASPTSTEYVWQPIWRTETCNSPANRGEFVWWWVRPNPTRPDPTCRRCRPVRRVYPRATASSPASKQHVWWRWVVRWCEACSYIGHFNFHRHATARHGQLVLRRQHPRSIHRDHGCFRPRSITSTLDRVHRATHRIKPPNLQHAPARPARGNTRSAAEKEVRILRRRAHAHARPPAPVALRSGDDEAARVRLDVDAARCGIQQPAPRWWEQLALHVRQAERALA